MKPEKDDMDDAPPSELNAAWPEHRSADLLDRIIVEQWLDSQVALIGGSGSLRAMESPRG